MGNILKHPYQKTLGYKIYDGYLKFTGGNWVSALIFALILLNITTDSALEAGTKGGGLGMDASGNLKGADFTQSSTQEFADNLGLSFTAVRVVGTVIIASGLVMTAIRYRTEDQAQRAQELLIRGALALLIINILPTIISFVAGAFFTGM